MSKTVKFAEQRLKEENEKYRQGLNNNHLVLYWAAYLDGAKAQVREDNSETILNNVNELTVNLLEEVSKFGKAMNKLIAEAQIELERLNADED